MKSLTITRSLRALVMLVGLVGTFAFAAMPKSITQDGPMPLCPPHVHCPDDGLR